jgi:hypothetical protein
MDFSLSESGPRVVTPYGTGALHKARRFFISSVVTPRRPITRASDK